MRASVPRNSRRPAARRCDNCPESLFARAASSKASVRRRAARGHVQPRQLGLLIELCKEYSDSSIAMTGNELKSLRSRLGLTQAALAEAVRRGPEHARPLGTGRDQDPRLGGGTRGHCFRVGLVGQRGHASARCRARSTPPGNCRGAERCTGSDCLRDLCRRIAQARLAPACSCRRRWRWRVRRRVRRWR